MSVPEHLPDIHSRMVVVEDRGIVVHVLEAAPNQPTPASDGSPRPLVLLLHGFPELSYSWRHVLYPLSKLGYHIVAPDLRGYGRTIEFEADNTKKASTTTRVYDQDLTLYTLNSTAADMQSLIVALKHERAECIIGHDFGSPVAATVAMLFPERVKSVVCMSAPFAGLPAHLSRPGIPSIQKQDSRFAVLEDALGSLDPPLKHYTAYYSTATANDDMMHDPRGLETFINEYFYVKGGSWASNRPEPLPLAAGSSDPDAVARAAAMMPGYYIMRQNETMPQTIQRLVNGETATTTKGISQDDMSVYAAEFERTGFQGGLNYYRANFHPHTGTFTTPVEIGPSVQLDKFQVPVMYVTGEKDWGAYQTPGALEKMRGMMLPGESPIGETVFIKDAGHWVQQENPEEVVAIIAKFLNAVSKIH